MSKEDNFDVADFGCDTSQAVPSEFYDRFNGKKINILGTEYTIHVLMPNSELLVNANTQNGFIESYSKEIFVCDHASLRHVDKRMYKKVEEYCMKILRHEIIHGVLFESGHPEWYDNEDLVDMLAYLMPKFIDIMSVQLPLTFYTPESQKLVSGGLNNANTEKR